MKKILAWNYYAQDLFSQKLALWHACAIKQISLIIVLLLFRFISIEFIQDSFSLSSIHMGSSVSKPVQFKTTYLYFVINLTESSLVVLDFLSCSDHLKENSSRMILMESYSSIKRRYSPIQLIHRHESVTPSSPVPTILVNRGGLSHSCSIVNMMQELRKSETPCFSPAS